MEAQRVREVVCPPKVLVQFRFSFIWKKENTHRKWNILCYKLNHLYFI